VWPSAGFFGGPLWTRWWTVGFRKMRGISWPARRLWASQEGLCSMELSRHYPHAAVLMCTRGSYWSEVTV
jgi:hypothetical protein